jgi:hypothetical protein
MPGSTSPTPGQRCACVARVLHARRHELVDLAAQHRDLAHEGAADELVLVAGGQEHRLDVRHQAAVHAGQLELVVEVGHGAQAAHHGLAAAGHDEVAQQAGEAFDRAPAGSPPRHRAPCRCARPA